MEGKNNTSSITEERIAQLNSIGFEWKLIKSAISEGWQKNFQLLRAFQNDNGHCRVPRSLVVDSIKLGQWVNNQRCCYKNRMEGKIGANTSITEERIALLNGI